MSDSIAGARTGWSGLGGRSFWFPTRLKRGVDSLTTYRAAFEQELGVITAEELSTSEELKVCF